MTTIAEIVRFRLTQGADPAAFITTARATDAWLAAQPGYLRRSLSQGSDGGWSDIVLWSDPAAAQGAAAALMADPVAAPFLALIDPASIEMRHEHVRMTSP